MYQLSIAGLYQFTSAADNRLPVEQGQLFEETLAADMAAITEELEQVSEPKPKGQATRKPLPPELPRTGFTTNRNQRPAPVAAN